MQMAIKMRRMRVIKLKRRAIAAVTDEPIKKGKVVKPNPIRLAPKKTNPAKKKYKPVVKQQLSARLYRDVKALFKTENADKLRTQAILDALTTNKSSTWSTILAGKPLDGRNLSLLLKPYGMHSSDIKFSGGKIYKGYKKSWFTA